MTDETPAGRRDSDEGEPTKRTGRLSPSDERKVAEALRRMQSPEMKAALAAMNRNLIEGPAGELGRQIAAQASEKISAIVRDSGILARQQEMLADVMRGSGLLEQHQQLMANIGPVRKLALVQFRW